MEESVYHAEYNNYSVTVRHIDDIAETELEFVNGVFSTKDEDVIKFLDNHVSRGVNFYKTSGEDKANPEEWRDELKPYDNPKEWDKSTINAFKNDETIHRCKYECGFASDHRNAVSSHENYCSQNSDDDENDNE